MSTNHKLYAYRLYLCCLNMHHREGKDLGTVCEKDDCFTGVLVLPCDTRLGPGDDLAVSVSEAEDVEKHSPAFGGVTEPNSTGGLFELLMCWVCLLLQVHCCCQDCVFSYSDQVSSFCPAVCLY